MKFGFMKEYGNKWKRTANPVWKEDGEEAGMFYEVKELAEEEIKKRLRKNREEINGRKVTKYWL